MALILILDMVAVLMIARLAMSRGLEQALPTAIFLLMIFPNESQIQLAGLFDITTQRLLVITIFCLYLIPGIGPGREDRTRPLPLKYLIILQIIWMVLAAVNSVVAGISIKAVLSQSLDFVLFYYVVCKTVVHRETVTKILSSLVSSMVFLSIFGVVESYSGWSVISLFPTVQGRFGGDLASIITADRGIRARATFPHPILFGCALSMAIPLALYLVTVTKSTTRRLWLWGGILVMFLDIYKTMSRGPWLALAFSLIAMFFFAPSRVRRYLTAVAFLSATVLITRPGVWQSISNLYGETLDPTSLQGTSYQWRYALYSIANRELTKSFDRGLWGYGPESFYYLGIKAEFQGNIVNYDTCDSSVVALMIETGYLGFLITAALLLKPALTSLRNFFKMASPERDVPVVLLINLGAYYFMMTNVACYGWGQQNYFLWTAMALSMIYPRIIAATAPSWQPSEISALTTRPNAAVAPATA